MLFPSRCYNISEGNAIFQNCCSPLQISYPNVRSSIADTPQQLGELFFLNRKNPTTFLFESRMRDPQLPFSGSFPFSKIHHLCITYSLSPSSGIFAPIASTSPTHEPENGLSMVISLYGRRCGG